MLALDDDRLACLQAADDSAVRRRRQPDVDLALVRLVVGAGDHDEGVVVFVDERFDRHGERVGTLLGDDLDAHRRAGGELRAAVEGDAHVGRDAGRIDRRRTGEHLALVRLVAARHEDAHGLADLHAPRSGIGTDATTCSRDGSMTRRITSLADASTMSPGLCLRLATTPAKRARTIGARLERPPPTGSPPAPAPAPRAPRSARACASSSSFCAATPCSTSVVRRVDRGLGVLDARLRLLDFGPSLSATSVVARRNLEADQQIAGA